NHEACQHEVKRLAQNHPGNVAAARAKRHSYADLIRAARDTMGHHAVQTDAREDQSERTKETNELRDQTILIQVVTQSIVKSCDAEDWQLIVDLVDHLPHLIRDRCWIRQRAHVNGGHESSAVLNL